MMYQFIVTQMMAEKGIKKHGERVIKALLKEFAQLNDFNTFNPLDPTSLSPQLNCEAFRTINLIKEKQGGCVDGRPQQKEISKEESTSPTCSNEALMLTMVIAAHEGSDVATANIQRAYLHIKMDKFVVIKLQGQIVDVLCERKPEYKKVVVEDNGCSTLYMQLLKALYGCIKSALLWYELFTGTL